MADRYSADSAKFPGGLHQVELPKDHVDWRPDVLQGLPAGQLSDVRKVGDAFCIARLERIEEPRTLAFADVEEAIRNALLEQKRADAQAAYVAELRRKARIQYLAGAEELGLHAAGPAR
jgi:hypothetical protein